MHEKNTTCVSSCLGNIAIKMAVICALSFTLSSFVVVKMKMNKQEENIDEDVVITQLLLAPLLLLFVFVRNPNVLFCSTSLCLGILSMLLTTLSRHYWQHSDATAPYKVSAMTSLAAYVITSLVSTLQPEQSSKITSTRRLKTIIAWLQTTLFLGYILSISAYQGHTNLISLPNVFALLTFVGFLFFAIVVAYEEFNQPSISKGLLNENIKTVLRGTVALNFAVLIGLCILDPEPSRGPYTAIRYLPPRGILLSTATVWISYSFFCEARTIVRYSAGKEIGVKIKKIVFLQALLVTGCGSLSLQAAVTQSYSVAYVMCLVSYTCFIPIGWFCVSLLRHNIREKEVCDARGAEIAIIKMELASLVNALALRATVQATMYTVDPMSYFPSYFNLYMTMVGLTRYVLIRWVVEYTLVRSTVLLMCYAFRR